LPNRSIGVCAEALMLIAEIRNKTLNNSAILLLILFSPFLPVNSGLYGHVKNRFENTPFLFALNDLFVIAKQNLTNVYKYFLSQINLIAMKILLFLMVILLF
jgi:hypothetical protein